MAKKNMIAMILAGGQGSRLGALTKIMAKPAVPFGSRYRIIDFALSNTANSGIDTVGVLTQYEPLALNTYVGNGHPWDLDRNNGGAFILPPYEHKEGSDWYKNTANSVFQNIGFIDKFDPKYVVILSGDHIYKMDYSDMLKSHLENNAECTIAVLEVPWEEASRFGIMSTDENDAITEFAEKPAEPKSNLASMGIYIFSWPSLRQALIEDEHNSESSHDFGKNIIPKFIDEKRPIYAYRFKGYWKDVGTIASIWEGNMELIDNPEQLSLRDPDWKINSRNPVKPAAYLGDKANVNEIIFTDGCRIYGDVSHSVLSHSVIVEDGAKVIDSVLMPGAIIRSGAVVEKAIIGSDSEITQGCIVGGDNTKGNAKYKSEYCSNGITVIAPGIVLKPNSIIESESIVEDLEDLTEADSVVEEIKKV